MAKGSKALRGVCGEMLDKVLRDSTPTKRGSTNNIVALGTSPGV